MAKRNYAWGAGSNVNAAISHGSKVSISNGVDNSAPDTTWIGEIRIQVSAELDRVRDVIALLESINNIDKNDRAVLHRGINALALTDSKLASIVKTLTDKNLEIQQQYANSIMNVQGATYSN